MGWRARRSRRRWTRLLRIFLTVEGPTYRDLLSFDAAADQGLLRVSWGVLQRQVVAAMNEGAGDAELARRVELVWQRPQVAGVTATAEVVEKVEFVGARQILTTARPDAWGSGVGVLHQAYIDDVSGALVDVAVDESVRASQFGSHWDFQGGQ